MIKLLKTFGKGILYVLGLPLLVAFLSVYFVISVLSFIYLSIQGIFLFFKGESLVGEMVEDKLARQRLNAMNNIQEDEDLEKYVIVENEKDKQKEIKNISDEEVSNNQPVVNNNQFVRPTAIIDEVAPQQNVPIIEPEPEENIPSIEPEPIPEPLPEPAEVKAAPIEETIINEDEIIAVNKDNSPIKSETYDDALMPKNEVQIEQTDNANKIDEQKNNPITHEDTILHAPADIEPQVEKEMPKPVNPMDEIMGKKTDTIDLNEASYFKHNKYIITHDDEEDEEDSGVDLYNYDGGDD